MTKCWGVVDTNGILITSLFYNIKAAEEVRKLFIPKDQPHYERYFVIREFQIE